MLRVLEMKYNTFFNFNSSFRTFFHGSGFFRIGSGFLAEMVVVAHGDLVGHGEVVAQGDE